MMPIARLSLLSAALLALGGCAAVEVRPVGDLPKALIEPTPARVGVVVTPEAASYIHRESRASVDYEAPLGESHKLLVKQIFEAEFREALLFDSLDAARAAPGLLAIFEPRIEQFSFASARETGGIYCAVTIRYQIAIYAPNGEQVDMLTLTGYGSGPAPKIGNGAEELAIAAFAAMRDAAAKFLTQFQGLDVAQPLLASQALQPKAQPLPGSPEALAAEAEMSIEAVPINDAPVTAAASNSPQAPVPAPASPVPPPAPSPTPPQMAPRDPSTTL